MPRPRKELPFPPGIRKGLPVKVTSPEFRGIKAGLVADMCKTKDGGITVWLTGDSTRELSVYVCIKPEEGDMLESLEERV